MYNSSNITINRKTVLQTIGIILLVILAIFVFTHGIITINNASGPKLFIYTPVKSDLSNGETKKANSFSVAQSGTYAVEFPLKDGRTNVQYVDVPRFILPVSITPDNTTRDISVLGRGTLPQIALKNNTLIGWNSDGSQQVINQSSVDNSQNETTADVFYPHFLTPYQVNSQLIGGVSRVDDTTYIPMYYDITTGDNISYETITSSTLSSKKESTGFSVYDKKSNSIMLYRPGSKSFKKVGIKDKELVSFFNNTPLYTISPKVTAYLKGGDISALNENEDIKQPDVDLQLVVIDNTTSNILHKESFKGSQIHNVQLSPNGKYLFIATNQSFAIYDTDTMSRVFYSPYTINQFLWVDSNRFTFATTDEGLFIGSLDKNQASNIANVADISPTSISFVANNEIFFTAYSTHNPSGSNPDAYKVSLTSPLSNLDNSVLKKLPHQGDGFYVDYINNHYIVQLTKYVYSTGESVSEEARQRAEDYINKNFGASHPPIEYIYVISDLRKVSDNTEE